MSMQAFRTHATPQEPVIAPPGIATHTDIQNALDDARDYLRGGGSWSPTLRWYANRWLDKMLELRGR